MRTTFKHKSQVHGSQCNSSAGGSLCHFFFQSTSSNIQVPFEPPLYPKWRNSHTPMLCWYFCPLNQNLLGFPPFYLFQLIPPISNQQYGIAQWTPPSGKSGRASKTIPFNLTLLFMSSGFLYTARSAATFFLFSCSSSPRGLHAPAPKLANSRLQIQRKIWLGFWIIMLTYTMPQFGEVKMLRW